MQGTIWEQQCGCEDNGSAFNPVSFCRRHAGEAEAFKVPAEELYRCGECGFQSRQWERLERHVYREHLGADRP